jgi:uncharacterized protein (DUF2267 family)
MKYDEFIRRVRERAKIESEEAALRAVEATLKTLGERLTDEEAAHLAAQLPPQIGLFLTVVDTNKTFDLTTFYQQVAQRESIGQPDSREHAQAVLSVVAETVTPGELRHVLDQLPDEFQDLLTFGSDWHKLEDH